MSVDVDSVTSRLAEIPGNTYKLVFYLFLLVWLAYMLIVAWPWAWNDKLVPYVVGLPAFLLLLLKIAKVAFPEQYDRVVPSLEAEDTAEDDESARLQETYKEIREESDAARPKEERIRYAIRMIAWALALPALMYLIGFDNALPIFMLAFGWRFYGSLRMTVIVTVVFTTLAFGFFYFILGIPLWDSALGLPSFLRVLGLVS